MISAETALEVETLLAEGRLSQRQIAQRLGISRGTVNNIARGRRVLRSRHRGETTAGGPEIAYPSGPVGRCRFCGSLVRQPCLACQLRATWPTAEDLWRRSAAW